MISKEYHFGVVAWFDEITSTWMFRAVPITGDDSPFMEMGYGEVYNNATYEWEQANQYRTDTNPTEHANGVLLDEAIRTANTRLARCD